MRVITLCAVAACLAALALADPTGDDRTQTTPEASDVDAPKLNDNGEKKITLLKQMTHCCRATKKVLSVFPLGGITCTGRHLWEKVYTFYKHTEFDKTIAPSFRDGCVVECIYRENNFLTDKNEIKENDLKEKIMEHIKGESKGFMAGISTFLINAKEVFSNKNKGNISELVKSYSPAIDSCFQMIHDHKDEIENLEGGHRGERKCKLSPQMLLTCLAGNVTLKCPESYWKEEKEECAGKQEELRTDFKNLIKGEIYVPNNIVFRNHPDLPNEGVEAKNNGE